MLNTRNNFTFCYINVSEVFNLSVIKHAGNRRSVLQLKAASKGDVREMYTPRTPRLYSKTGVYRGFPIFYYFCSRT